MCEILENLSQNLYNHFNFGPNNTQTKSLYLQLQNKKTIFNHLKAENDHSNQDIFFHLITPNQNLFFPNFRLYQS